MFEQALSFIYTQTLHFGANVRAIIFVHCSYSKRVDALNYHTLGTRLGPTLAPHRDKMQSESVRNLTIVVK